MCVQDRFLQIRLHYNNLLVVDTYSVMLVTMFIDVLYLYLLHIHLSTVHFLSISCNCLQLHCKA